MSESGIYFIYVFLNTLKQGIFKYGSHTFEFEPIYVGKGTKRRQVNIWARKSSKLKDHLLKGNYEQVTLFQCADETEVYEKERKLIKLIGRQDLGKGPLWNKTDGGAGLSGCLTHNLRKDSPHRKEIDRKSALARTGIPCSDSRRANIKAALARKKANESKRGN